ncbi:MAG: DUF503 domain-containing protein [Deltaproteobacteria bacterium]|nr:DUF503 domain-containing protein [Deltaproteobacteria bacterium]
MVVGVCRVGLMLPGCSSLKEKRSIVKRILGRVRAKFNVAGAEVGYQDIRDRARLGFAAVGSDRDLLRNVLEKLVDFIEAQYLGEVIEEDFEVENYGG